MNTLLHEAAVDKFALSPKSGDKAVEEAGKSASRLREEGLLKK